MANKLKYFSIGLLLLGLISCSEHKIPDYAIKLNNNNYIIAKKVSVDKKDCFFSFYTLHNSIVAGLNQYNKYEVKKLKVPNVNDNLLVLSSNSNIVVNRKNLDNIYNDLNTKNYYFDDKNLNDFNPKIFESCRVSKKDICLGYLKEIDYTFKFDEGIKTGAYSSFLVANKIHKYSIVYEEYSGKGKFIKEVTKEYYLLKDVTINVMSIVENENFTEFPTF
ncbi:MAG: hypothetical protein ACTTID_02215 [Bacillales bacterium]